MFKHRLQWNLYFAFLVVGLPIFWNSMNWGLLYGMYFLIMGLGVGLGIHRILCHEVKLWKPLEYVCVYFGVLSHTGPLKGSVLWHINHHVNTDSDDDIYKSYLEALRPRVGKIRVPKEDLRRAFQYIENDFILRTMDRYYYLVHALTYLAVGIVFGWDNLVKYVLVPASLSLLVHSFATVSLHRRGYRNFPLADKSHNSLLLWFLMFGENWHNNHHFHPESINKQFQWWELDPLYLLTYPFYKVRPAKKPSASTPTSKSGENNDAA
jgi:fatty-acid desaturase